MKISNLIEKTKVFGANTKYKKEFLNNLKKILCHHYKNCNEIKNFFKKQNVNLNKIKKIEDLPFRFKKY